MKVERPPHHKPVTKEDASSPSDVGADILSDCLSQLSIASSDGSKIRNNILPDTVKSNEREKKDEKNDRRDEKREETKKKERQEAKVKEGEKQKEKKEPSGDLLSRGPVAVDPKWKAQSLASRAPYQMPQSNTSRTNGGGLLYNRLSTTSYPEFSYTDSLLSPEQYATTKGDQEVHGGNVYSNLISEQNIQITNSELSGTLIETTFCETAPVGANIQEEDIRKCIEEVTSDPNKVESLLQHIQTMENNLHLPEMPLMEQIQAIETNLNLMDVPPNKITYNIPGHRSPHSPNQVVPERRPSFSSSSAYSNCSGSPSGPSSPNFFYGHTPNSSPNVPSPHVNPYDDGAKYSSAYYPVQSPMQYPQPLDSPFSTCCLDSFDININEIISKPVIKDKKKFQEIKKSIEEDFKAKSIGQTQPITTIQPTNSPILVVVPTVPNQPSFQRIPATSSSSSSSRPLRALLPKPVTMNMLPQSDKPSSTQESYRRQLDRQSKFSQTLSTYPKPAKEQLLQRLDPEKKRNAWIKARSCPLEEIASVDQDGDTALMILVCLDDILQKLEHLYATVELYKEIDGLLALRNNDKQSALYMACMTVHKEPLVAKYIAEALVDIDYDLNVRDEDDLSTLIHQLCKGDIYSRVLDELLSLRDKRGKTCFDINMTDSEGRTPLHLAVETHYNVIPCLEIVKVLLRHGANVLEKDGKQGSTALHLALATKNPDENLVHTLCNFCDCVPDKVVKGMESKMKLDLVTAKNFKGDTPLHVAMAYGGTSDNYILDILMKAGAARAIRNHNGKAPLELAPETRKVEIKKILDKYNVK